MQDSGTRVVITGLGIVSPAGNSIDQAWEKICSGSSCVGKLSRFDAASFGSRISGEVRGFNPYTYLRPRQADRLDRAFWYDIAAATDALADAGLKNLSPEESLRAGACIGTCYAGMRSFCAAQVQGKTQGRIAIPASLIAGTLPNMASALLSIRFGLKGPNQIVSTACASGLTAIIEACWMIRRGDADVMLAGGCEDPIVEAVAGSFDNMHALSRLNECPERAVKPFDRNRSGFAIAEGAGILVLESYEHAVAREARIYAEVLGAGLSSDAFHVTAPSFEGGLRCIRSALISAGLAPEQIDYVNAHGTGTIIGDRNEARILAEVFKGCKDMPPVSSIKGCIGHTLGAAGAIDAICSVLAIRDAMVPPCTNCLDIDPDCPINVVTGRALHKPVRHVLKNNFGFGGANASVIFGAV